MTDDSTGLSEALLLWPRLEQGIATLINLSENHTFRIDRTDGGKAIVRVHRPGYHSRLAIESELAWMQALRRDAGLFTPQPLPGKNGALVQQGQFLGQTRHMVAFAFEQGAEPQVQDDLAPVFRQLGGLAAQCHSHVIDWSPPQRFERQVWTGAAILDPDAIWGDWRAAPGVAGPVRATLDRLDIHLRGQLAEYGTGRDRFGLIHADMRLANLLVSDGVTRLIDFDDCGFCWFGYDFGAAVSFFEDSDTVPALRAAWLEGYRRYRDYGAEHEAMLDAMVMLRRMALLAWTGSHAETELAQSLHSHFANGTAEMAERYLSTGTIDR
ncbi:phosphotransferase enzyme family protein [Pelagibacterium halotolerans]|uniref:Aminoglycoside phosphotransferase n=1 Tax=Pelagibacterium halotolerans (strain DSM 22347 / JCM 15775 / CGMCC 1.7692 / B2) TaxID=1082931 RepID=G4R6H8_PELHB|nr:phosphotransferase [Pelagibacterium halotolerans]AEQ51174.1 aminoglycoside phosphotransferase [Pelagibacterium halotolerans B2]QJR18959.1 phosphotransferase [Pelagibacterium halotolerans]SEA69067.1 Ser/Thr protein kinase RdoA involved in Cpx stress response, MazF antagonist [Pelagibacterium halotolerans]